jgi:hypothetical protein
MTQHGSCSPFFLVKQMETNEVSVSMITRGCSEKMSGGKPKQRHLRNLPRPVIRHYLYKGNRKKRRYRMK